MNDDACHSPGGNSISDRLQTAAKDLTEANEWHAAAMAERAAHISRQGGSARKVLTVAVGALVSVALSAKREYRKKLERNRGTQND